MDGPWTEHIDDAVAHHRIKAAAFEVPGKGRHFLTVRGQLFNHARCSEGMPMTLFGLRALLLQDLAPLDALGSGTAAAAAILATDRRLPLECLVAIIGARTPAARRNRAQALLEFPLLVRILAMQRQPSVKVRFLPDLVASMVDEGQPLVRSLARLFHAPPWAIRHLRGLAAEDVEPYLSMPTLAQHIGALIPERAPARHGYALLDYLFGSELSERPWLAIAARRSVLKGGWPELGTRLARMPSFVDYASFVEALVGGLPELDGPLRGEKIDRALGEPTLAQVQCLSRRWHEIEAGIRDEAAPAVVRYDAHADTWPALFPRPRRVGGYEMRSLTDRASLEVEGRALKHCVGGYAGRCAAGISHIVGIRRRGENVATAELRVVRRGTRLSLQVRQVSGVRNSAPEPGAVTALERAAAEVPAELLEALPAPDDSMATAANQAPGQLFVDTLARLGHEALALYRPCLQVSPSKSGLWHAVESRFGA
jgi:hypothetical protein